MKDAIYVHSFSKFFAMLDSALSIVHVQTEQWPLVISEPGNFEPS